MVEVEYGVVNAKILLVTLGEQLLDGPIVECQVDCHALEIKLDEYLEEDQGVRLALDNIRYVRQLFAGIN